MSNSVNLSLDVTKTGIQNPLIKVRQGDGGFETLRTTVTANGEPMDLQGWTITFMGTTAGNHKIVDGNVTLVEAPNGIFDYTPSKAWGMDIGDFKIAYFKFVKGDGSASSANFRVSVIEAVDLTQEEAQNYISVVDTTIATINKQLNDSLANVTQSIADANKNANAVASNVNALGNRVDDYNKRLAAVKVGGRNYILNSKRALVGSGSFEDTNWVYTSMPINAFSNKTITISVQVDYDNVTSVSGRSRMGFEVAANQKNADGTKVTKTFGAWQGVSVGDSFHGRIYSAFDLSNINLESRDTSNQNLWSNGMFIQGVTGTNVSVSNPKIEIGNVPTDWTPAPEDAPSNDAQLVHKTGTETIAGYKTFTGNNKFTSAIDGSLKTREATFTDFATVANDMFAYAGNWFTKPTVSVANSPYQNAFGVVEVIPGDAKGSGRIIFTPYDPGDGNIYYNSVSWKGLGPWLKVANDNDVVHKTATETIVGDKTFIGVSTLTNIKSSVVNTGSVALNGLTIDFRQTVLGVNVYMHGTFAGTFGTDQSYVTSSSVIPSNINNPAQTVVLTIVSNGGVSGITNNSPWELEVLLTPTGAIQYRAKNLRDNDITARNTSIVGADSAFYTIE